MQVLPTIQEMRAACRAVRQRGQSLGFVPTMGALHAGHISLVRAARAQCDVVAASIFVNPTQFAPNEDFAKYPRTFEQDRTLLEAEGVALIFAPTPEEMYPTGATTFVEVTDISDRLDGASRPGHFRGVATVVAKLFHVVAPDKAFFGQKDAAQVAVLRRMVRDLNFDLELIVCPIVREPDGLDRFHKEVSRQDKPDAAFPSTPGSPATGSRRRGGRKAALHGRGAEPSNCENGLALSSRNRYLSAQERAQALVLSRALNAISAAYRAGETSVGRLLDAGHAVMAQEPEVRIDYFAIVDPDTLLPLDDAAPGALVAVAAYVGSTRLIDNIIL